MTATAPPDTIPGDSGDLDSPVAEPLARTLDRIVEFNRRFITHRLDSTHDLVALWVASTHAMPVWDWHGRLYITAPQPGCGKTTQAEVMALLSANSDQTASTSGPGLFRNISANQPTLFLDEAESQFSRHSGRDGDIVNQVINRGYKRGAVVTRSEGNQAVKHEVFAAVAIVGIDNGTLSDTTRSRCIPVQMVPGKKGERFRERQHEVFAAEMQWQLANAALDLVVSELPDGFGRTADIWEALYSVAVAAGEGWVARCQQAAGDHGWPDVVSDSAQVLGAIRDYFKASKADRVRSSDLVRWLNAREDIPHVTSPRALSLQWLRGYRTPDGQHIRSTKSNGNFVYWRKDFLHAFDTWLPS
ncbi:DUF3631 domain-containing protein [Nocardioides sp.]|uniref:DUF3631 domain-containing protein n=1 Tax=Nocardioides sp. TaxID=35761 RepID=UPI00262FA22C|nr:DUF3631 domain-containing protein [Nocardioides sp.]